MIVIPAIDLRGGKIVRLVRGEPEQQTVYDADPAAVARRFEEKGAAWIHVVDLDSALGTGSNHETVAAICDAVRIPVQVGGGLRSVVAMMQAQIAGARRIVLGTAAAADPDFVRSAVNRYHDRVVVAVDVRGDRVMVNGWKDDAGSLDELLPRLAAVNAPRFLVTSIGVDGTMAGPDLPLYERVLALTDRPVQASGGVGAADDLIALEAIGVEGTIVGRALYEGKLKLGEVARR